MKRLIFACSLAACLSASPALGQEPVGDEAYQTAIGEAVAEFSAGRWEEARSLFTEAHRINPNARTLRGLGMTAFELRNYVEALQMLQRAMESQINPLTPDQRAKTEELLTRARAFVGVFDVEGPEGMGLTVDGLVAPRDGHGRLLLNTGKRRISVRFADGTESARSMDVRGGETGTLVFQSEQQGPATAPVPVPVAAAEGGTQTDGAAELQVEVEPGGGSALPIVLTVVGGGLVVGGVITGLLAKGAEGDLEDACGDMKTRCPESNRSSRDSAVTLSTVTNTLWVGGAVLAALGVTLLILEGGDEAPVQARLDVAPDSAGLNVWGRF